MYNTFSCNIFYTGTHFFHFYTTDKDGKFYTLNIFS